MLVFFYAYTYDIYGIYNATFLITIDYKSIGLKIDCWVCLHALTSSKQVREPA